MQKIDIIIHISLFSHYFLICEDMPHSYDSNEVLFFMKVGKVNEGQNN